LLNPLSEQEWDDLMGAGSYAEAKAAEICCMAKDIAARELGSTSRRLFFFSDASDAC
jgi:hypothetical protein